MILLHSYDLASHADLLPHLALAQEGNPLLRTGASHAESKRGVEKEKARRPTWGAVRKAAIEVLAGHQKRGEKRVIFFKNRRKRTATDNTRQ